MTTTERRSDRGADRRQVPRGGRREGDQPGQFPHLLVADSYDGVRVPCVRYLTKFGFHVEQAADGNEALAKIEATPPHMILVESGLPIVPVSEIARQLRDRAGTQSIPIILMDSGPDRGGSEDAPHAGRLVKPFALSAMLQEVRRVLREYPPVVSLRTMSKNAGA
jgi:DNA-binding response OmpR family regulator